MLPGNVDNPRDRHFPMLKKDDYVAIERGQQSQNMARDPERMYDLAGVVRIQQR
jgi:hypothetical protein